jgi:tetratricopeptide (TPR) repeat protein
MKKWFSLSVAVIVTASVLAQSLPTTSTSSSPTSRRGRRWGTYPRMSNEDARKAYERGLALQDQGKMAEAIEQYKVATGPGSVYSPALNHYAWILATSADAKLRDGEQAVRLAERATRFCAKDPASSVADYFDTLAGAYAEAGRFDDAVEAEGKGIKIIEIIAPYDRAKLADFKSRIDVYKQKKPYHQDGTRRPADYWPADD